ncbi:MAG: helix-turn-helix domain-containing protein [Acidobacteria bacterium]|nr:helix-turn-helix domain-containing protein [Acidobacteriota bacterium]
MNVFDVREVLDIKQAAEFLGVSTDTLYKYACSGFVPAFKLGNRWRFKRSRLDAWMDGMLDFAEKAGKRNSEDVSRKE